MATLSFDLPTKLATVGIADTEITVQEIYDQFRDFEDLPTTMSNSDLVTAAGKDTLAGGAQTIITVRLLDGWRVKFADRAGPGITECVITGGNLVASTELGADQIPVAPSDFVFVSLANATTGAIQGLGLVQSDMAWLALFHRDGARVTDDEDAKERLYTDRTLTTVDSEWDLFSDDELTTPWDGIQSIKGRQPST